MVSCFFDRKTVKKQTLNIILTEKKNIRVLKKSLKFELYKPTKMLSFFQSNTTALSFEQTPVNSPSARRRRRCRLRMRCQAFISFAYCLLTIP